MADQHVSRRATGAIRWLGVLALLLGIAAMHAGVFSVATATTHDTATAATHDMPIAATHDTATAATYVEPTATAPDMTESPTMPDTAGAAAERALQTVGHSLAVLSALAMDSHPAPIHVQHACEVFVLAAATLLLGLVLLGWVSRAPESDRLGAGSGRAHRERPPPWTVPSLTQLSILRI
ncbi:hypothetical protein [Nocardia sp. NPDC004722]